MVSRRPQFPFLAALIGALAVAGCKPVSFTAPSGCKILATANPAEIALTTGTSTITVSVNEGSGVPAPDGTVISFTTTLGSITPELKVKDGVVRATLQAGSVGGAATVTAFSGACGPATVEVRIGVTTDSIALTSSPASLPPGGGSVQLSATVFGANGSPVPGATIVFSASQGTLASRGLAITTDGSGRAVDTLSTVLSSDVTATAGSKTKTVTVPVGSTGISTIVLSAKDANLPSTGGTTSLSAVVLGDAGPLPGVAVAWSASAGSLGSSGVTITNSNGVATNSITSTLTSTITAAAGSKTAQVTVTVGAGTSTAQVAISASRSSILAAPAPVGTCASSGSDLPITLYAQVTDSNGDPIVNRQVLFYVDFTELSDCGRSFGQFCGGTTSVTATTDANGVATAQYTATQADFDSCNCLPSGCNCYPASVMVVCPGPATTTPTPAPTAQPGLGYCPSPANCSNNATCRTTPAAEDSFCQVAIRAVSGGVESPNVQFIEYGK